MYYDYRIIDGFNAPINVVISKRGLGKTFGRVIRCIKRFKEIKKRFIYVVETEEMVDVLSQNRGEKFFSKIIEYLEKQESNNSVKFLNFIQGANVEESEKINEWSKIKGGTIFINNDTAGYIVSLNGFSKLKRNNFINIREIIIDEFIPENVDVRSLKNVYKLVNIIQSIARTQKDIKIYMLGNAIRLNDNILIKMKLNNLKLGEMRKVKDKFGLLLICHYVDNKEYEEFKKIADESVAGRLAKLTGEDNEEENKFIDEIDKDLLIPSKMKNSHFLFCIHDNFDSVRIHATKDYSQYYVFEDYGRNENNRYCFEQKNVTPIVKLSLVHKDYLLKLYNNNMLKFENSTIYNLFKKILKIL